MSVSVIGAGPAGLMAAEVMAQAGLQVTIFEAKPSPARKFLMAGKSGLNLTFSGDFDKVLRGYGDRAEALTPALEAFDNAALLEWAEGLGQEMFTGSTGRVFPRAMKASPLVRAWLARLDDLGVVLQRRWRWTGWEGDALQFDTPDGVQCVRSEATVLACGGASWARLGSDGAWAEWIETVPFKPANVGLRVAWSPHMAKHLGQPVKGVAWRAGDVTSRGEAVLSASGLEGGGIYSISGAVREGAALTLDVVPDLDADEVAKRFAKKSKKATLSRWLRQGLRLSDVKIALVQEFARAAQPLSAADWARVLKALRVPVAGPMDMDGAISTAGGVPFDALDNGLMLRARPGVFCAGEMLDWEAPTGGWLLTGCFATGAWAGRNAATWLAAQARAQP